MSDRDNERTAMMRPPPHRLLYPNPERKQKHRAIFPFLAGFLTGAVAMLGALMLLAFRVQHS